MALNHDDMHSNDAKSQSVMKRKLQLFNFSKLAIQKDDPLLQD
jgi:hypothetical protein